MGMVIRKVNYHFDNKKKQLFTIIGLGILLIGWQYCFLNLGYNLELESMFGGKQVSMTWANAVETIIIFFLIKEAVSFIEAKQYKVLAGLFSGIIFIGRHTLYIFLYHILFLDIYIKYLHLDLKWLNRCCCLLFIISGPIILEYVIKRLCSWLKTIMREVKVDS